MKTDFKKTDYYTKQIPNSLTKEWILKKHYAHTRPPIEIAIGLYNLNHRLCGVCTFGQSVNPYMNKLLKNCPILFNITELNRLVVDEGLPKNTLSYFVSQSLKYLKTPMVVISYADGNQNHHGYIYQATNFYYIGYGRSRSYVLLPNGKKLHNRNFKDTNEMLVYCEKHNAVFVSENEQKKKYRYIKFLGNKKEIKDMKKSLKYKCLPYPKGINIRYKMEK